MMTGKAAEWNQHLKKSMFLGSSDAVLADMDIDQAVYVLCACLAVHLNSTKNMRITEYIITLSCDRGVAVALLNGGQY